MTESDYFSKLRADFEEFYYQKLWHKLADMEEKRIKYLNRFWLLFFILAVALPLFILWSCGEWLYLIFTQGSSKEIEGVVKLILIAVAVIIAIVGSPIISYHIDVKDSIIKDFINFFGTFKHHLFKHIDDETIKKKSTFQ